ncbi:MAG: sigma-70 family RNA polymerase sigma factor [Planctomycetes bacterium]|nr:sigma-70 family RNA polymerase sigma factor [Planctomycetota bacterium]
MVTDAVKIQNCLLNRAIYDKDRKALGRLYSIYYSRMKYHIASRINSVSDAEDLSQNVFLELCKGKGRYDGRNAEVYLFGMARNIIARYCRNNIKHLQTVQMETVGDIVAESDVCCKQSSLSEQFKKLLKDVTEQLPPKARDAIRARLIEGLSPKEAAKKCGCSTDAFYKRFDAALKALNCSNMKK